MRERRAERRVVPSELPEALRKPDVPAPSRSRRVAHKSLLDRRLPAWHAAVLAGGFLASIVVECTNHLHTMSSPPSVRSPPARPERVVDPIARASEVCA